MKNFIKILIIIFLISTKILLAEKDSLYSINFEIGGGITENYNPNSTKTNFKSLTRFIYPSLRLMWTPEHLLSIGVSSAYLQISKIDLKNQQTEFGLTDLKIRTSAIPILFTLKMEFNGVTVTGGLGSSFTQSQINAYNQTSISEKWINTFYYSTGYNYHFNKYIYLGLDGEYYSFSELKSGIFSLKLKFGYNIISF